MAKYKGTVAITGPISPTDTLDLYATHLASLGQGGYRSVLTLVDRDAILPLRREAGMVVYVIETQKEYRLVGGILNTNWSDISGTGGGTAPSVGNYLITNDLITRDAIPVLDRAIGKIAYVISEKAEYRLVGDVANTNWEKIVSTGTGTTGPADYVISLTIAERDSISLNDRKIGMISYVVADDTEYRLVNGTANTNWTSLNGTSQLKDYMILDSLATRNTIPSIERQIGLTTYIKDVDKEYRLVGGTSNVNWVELNSSTGGSTGTGGLQGYYQIVTSLSDLENYPMADRVKGLTLYVSDADQEYRLMKGIDNTNWVLISDPVIVNVGSTTTTTNPDGSTSVANSYTYTTNNYYENKIGDLNKSLVLDIINNTVKDIGTYIDSTTGNPVVSTEDTSTFSFSTTGDTYWIDDMISFVGSTEIRASRVCKTYIEVTDDGVTTKYDLADLFATNSGISPKFELYGNITSWYGYFKFGTFGQKDIKVWEEQDGILSYNINKSIYIFAANFVVRDGAGLVPTDLIETPGNLFTSKEYNIDVPLNTNLIISLAKVNVTSKGIDKTNMSVVLNSTGILNASGVYKINFTDVRNQLVDSQYALVINGTENGAVLPTYLFGPFIIDLL